MPHPVSDIEKFNVTLSPLEVDVIDIEISPASVNFIALLSRFVITCRILEESPIRYLGIESSKFTLNERFFSLNLGENILTMSFIKS